MNIILDDGCWLRGHATVVTCTWILRMLRAWMVVAARFAQDATIEM